ncbi:Rv1733c family protein [Microtetraspora malaysiensis]|uniref:Rv1733c family protein n=1 Tax=Microtetraspora malaysiensis TaxID=161358 RepID=UPI003D8B516F
MNTPISAKLARFLGLDHNPLRRTADHVESTILITLFILFTAIIPVGTYLATRTAYVTAQTENTGKHQVTATLYEQPSPAQGSRLGGTAEFQAGARWQTADGKLHEAVIPVRGTATVGTKVNIWVNAHNEPSREPAGALEIIMATVIVALAALSGLVAVLAMLVGLLRRTMRRLNRKGWEEAWTSVEPRWARRY